MKTTGTIRKMDELGRIVLPVELRRMLDISSNDQVDIVSSGDTIILKKHPEKCVFCFNENQKVLYGFSGKLLCDKCIGKIAELSLQME